MHQLRRVEELLAPVDHLPLDVDADVAHQRDERVEDLRDAAAERRRREVEDALALQRLGELADLLDERPADDVRVVGERLVCRPRRAGARADDSGSPSGASRSRAIPRIEPRPCSGWRAEPRVRRGQRSDIWNSAPEPSSGRSSSGRPARVGDDRAGLAQAQGRRRQVVGRVVEHAHRRRRARTPRAARAPRRSAAGPGSRYASSWPVSTRVMSKRGRAELERPAADRGARRSGRRAPRRSSRAGRPRKPVGPEHAIERRVRAERAPARSLSHAAAAHGEELAPRLDLDDARRPRRRPSSGSPSPSGGRGDGHAGRLEPGHRRAASRRSGRRRARARRPAGRPGRGPRSRRRAPARAQRGKPRARPPRPSSIAKVTSPPAPVAPCARAGVRAQLRAARARAGARASSSHELGQEPRIRCTSFGSSWSRTLHRALLAVAQHGERRRRHPAGSPGACR